jgi:O-antigen/teichoic acid export membrane protein
MRIRTRSFVIMFSQGVTQATMILLGIILVRLVSKETLGTYRQVFLVYTFLGGLLSLQLENSLYYFLPKCLPGQRRALLLQTVGTKVVFAFVTCLIMLLGASLIAGMLNNPALTSLLPIFSVYALLASIIPLIPAFMISLDRAVWAGIYSMADSVSRVCIVVIMFAMGCNLASVLWASIIAAGIISAVGLLDMARLCSTGQWRFDRLLFCEQLSYTWPFLAISLIGVVNIQLDKFLISVFFDPATYAIYSCGAIELPIVALITGSVTAAIMPNLVTFAQQGEPLRALELWKQAVRKTALIIFPCFIFFIFISKNLIVLLYGASYSMAVWPFSVYLFLLPIRIATYSTLFRAVGKTKPIAISAAINLFLNVLLSTSLAWLGAQSLLSFVGPSIGAVVANIAAAGYLMWQLTKILNVRASFLMNWKELGQLLFICTVCGLIAAILPLPNYTLLITIVIRAAIFCCVQVSSLLIFNMLTADEKRMLLTPLNLLRNISTKKGS